MRKALDISPRMKRPRGVARMLRIPPKFTGANPIRRFATSTQAIRFNLQRSNNCERIIELKYVDIFNSETCHAKGSAARWLDIKICRPENSIGPVRIPLADLMAGAKAQQLDWCGLQVSRPFCRGYQESNRAI